MPIKVREGNTWKEVANDIAVPEVVTGTYTHYTNRVHNNSYQNTTSKLIHVNATLGINRNQQLGGENPHGQSISGSNAIAWIGPTSSSVSFNQGTPSTSNITEGIVEVAQVRDNGSWNTEFLFLNTQFFVPVGYWYIIKVFLYHGVQWTSSVTTYTWSELSFGLQ
jgi:hypothetical protein